MVVVAVAVAGWEVVWAVAAMAVMAMAAVEAVVVLARAVGSDAGLAAAMLAVVAVAVGRDACRTRLWEESAAGRCGSQT